MIAASYTRWVRGRPLKVLRALGAGQNMARRAEAFAHRPWQQPAPPCANASA